MIAEIGLILIALAWLVQLVISNKNQIVSTFVLLYIIGVAFLIVDGFLAGLNSLAILNLVTAVLAFFVLIKIGNTFAVQKQILKRDQKQQKK